jgi:hypothetical protein
LIKVEGLGGRDRGGELRSDPTFLADYGAVPVPGSVEGHTWDGGDGKSGDWGGDAKTENWDVGDAGLLAFDAFGRGNK